MKDFLATLGFDNLGSLLSALATVVLAVIAYMGLSTWKEKEKANRKLAFLDELLEEIHLFCRLISRPLQTLEFLELSIDTFSEKQNTAVRANSEKTDTAYDDIRRLIQNAESFYGKKIKEELPEVEKITSKINRLITKGQVFGFSNYSKLYNPCIKLIHPVDILRSMIIILENPNFNFNNPDVKKLILKTFNRKSGDMKKEIQTQNKEVLEYIQTEYGKII